MTPRSRSWRGSVRRRVERTLGVLALCGSLFGPVGVLRPRWEPSLDPRVVVAGLPASGGGRRSGARLGIATVPYPRSLALLAVAHGVRPGDPFPEPQVCGPSFPRVPYPQGFALLRTSLRGGGGACLEGVPVLVRGPGLTPAGLGLAATWASRASPCSTAART